MRAVIDTNVAVSALINRHGPPGRVVAVVLSRSVTILYDDRIFAEYRAVLRRSEFPFLPNEVEEFLDFVETNGEYVSGISTNVVLPDITDLPFLEVAIAGLADALVTGNTKHFKPLRGRHNIRIVTPAEFIRGFVQ